MGLWTVKVLFKLTFDLKHSHRWQCSMQYIIFILALLLLLLENKIKKKINEKQTSTSNNAPNINKLFVRAQVEPKTYCGSICCKLFSISEFLHRSHCCSRAVTHRLCVWAFAYAYIEMSAKQTFHDQ